MNYRKILIASIILIIGFVLVVLPVLAQDGVIKFRPQVEIPGSKFIPGEEIPVTPTSFAEYLKAFFDWSIRAIVIIGVVMIMVGGFQWMIAAGNAPKVGQAKARIISALIGIGLALGSFTILNFISPSLTRLEGIKLGEVIVAGRGIEKESVTVCISTVPGVILASSGERCKTDKIKIWNATIRGGGQSATRLGDFQIIGHEKCAEVDFTLSMIGSKCDTGKVCAINLQAYSETNPLKFSVGLQGGIKKADYKNARCEPSLGLGSLCTVESGIDGICKDMGDKYPENAERNTIYLIDNDVCKTTQCPPPATATTICCKPLNKAIKCPFEKASCVYGADDQIADCGCKRMVFDVWLDDADDDQIKERSLAIWDNKDCGFVYWNTVGSNNWRIGNKCADFIEECVIQKGKYTETSPLNTELVDVDGDNTPMGTYEYVQCSAIPEK